MNSTLETDVRDVLARRVLATVAVLFARRDSVYKTLPDCDVWDADRDALGYSGTLPVVAHPPCRAWSELSPFAKPRPGEKELSPWAIEQVRRCGGVLEHPAKSKLWRHMGIPLEGSDGHGWTFAAPQFWWGHPCNKATRFYVVGCDRRNVPPVPFVLGEAPFVQTYSHECRRRPQMPHSLREHTPLALAHWLVELARLCSQNH